MLTTTFPVFSINIVSAVNVSATIFPLFINKVFSISISFWLIPALFIRFPDIFNLETVPVEFVIIELSFVPPVSSNIPQFNIPSTSKLSAEAVNVESPDISKLACFIFVSSTVIFAPLVIVVVPFFISPCSHISPIISFFNTVVPEENINFP